MIGIFVTIPRDTGCFSQARRPHREKLLSIKHLVLPTFGGAAVMRKPLWWLC
jgi:hypothetical protein